MLIQRLRRIGNCLLMSWEFIPLVWEVLLAGIVRNATKFK